MAKLFVSYVGLVSNFYRGEIDEFDLNSGYFYLGRAREDVITANGVSPLWPFWLLHDDPVARFKIHTRLTNLLKQADIEGRVLWRQRGKSPSYTELNHLLYDNREGEIPLQLAHDNGEGKAHDFYSCLGVLARVKAAGLSLDVVY